MKKTRDIIMSSCQTEIKENNILSSMGTAVDFIKKEMTYFALTLLNQRMDHTVVE